jgi:hypothetical protein
MPHDWFSKLTGFREESYQLTRSQLDIEGDELVSTVNGKRWRREPFIADIGRIAQPGRRPS